MFYLPYQRELNMNFTIQKFIGVGLISLVIGITPLAAQEQQASDLKTVPVTLDQFPTAETHLMMKLYVDAFDCLGKWAHVRGFVPIDEQKVVRMNRDTLYSSTVLDLSEPATLIKPDTNGRYQSILVINEGHFSKLTAYDAGEYELTKEAMGSRYVAVIVRTLVDAEDPKDLIKAHKAQDGLKVTQKSIGQFDVPNWDPVAMSEMRDALKVLGNHLPNRDGAYGDSKEKVDPVNHLITTADQWGGWLPKNAVYQSYFPQDNSGNTAYKLTLKDVPVGDGAFWSISVYNEAGYFQQNESDKYVINSRKATVDKDGAVTIHFGGDKSQPNFLPIMKDWNYMLRIYLPESSYLDGTWVAPEAQLVK